MRLEICTEKREIQRINIATSCKIISFMQIISMLNSYIVRINENPSCSHQSQCFPPETANAANTHMRHRSQHEIKHLLLSRLLLIWHFKAPVWCCIIIIFKFAHLHGEGCQGNTCLKLPGSWGLGRTPAPGDPCKLASSCRSSACILQTLPRSHREASGSDSPRTRSPSPSEPDVCFYRNSTNLCSTPMWSADFLS